MSKSKQVSKDREILALKPAGKRYEVSVSDARGLTIRVYPSGEWMFEYRYVAANGKRRRMVLGRYPALRLADARIKATKFLTSVIDGQDPSAERKADKRAKRIGKTMAELTEAYFKAARKGLHGGRKKPKRESTVSNEKRLYDRHIGPKLKDQIVTELKRRDIKEFMRDLATDSGLAASSVGWVGKIAPKNDPVLHRAQRIAPVA